MIKKPLSLICTISLTFTLSGCFATASQNVKLTSADLSQDKAALIIDNQSTRADVLSLFGSPNGFTPGLNSGGTTFTAESIKGPDYMLHYKDCEIGSKGRGVNLFTAAGTAVEKCSVFTAIVNKQDVVTSSAYHPDNLVTEQKISKLQPNKSTLKDVIKALGGPTQVIKSGKSVVYKYSNCERTNVISKNPFNFSQRQDVKCQKASVILNGNDFVVQKVNFFPIKK